MPPTRVVCGVPAKGVPVTFGGLSNSVDVLLCRRKRRLGRLPLCAPSGSSATVVVTAFSAKVQFQVVFIVVRAPAPLAAVLVVCVARVVASRLVPVPKRLAERSRLSGLIIALVLANRLTFLGLNATIGIGSAILVPHFSPQHIVKRRVHVLVLIHGIHMVERVADSFPIAGQVHGPNYRSKEGVILPALASSHHNRKLVRADTRARGRVCGSVCLPTAQRSGVGSLRLLANKPLEKGRHGKIRERVSPIRRLGRGLSLQEVGGKATHARVGVRREYRQLP